MRIPWWLIVAVGCKGGAGNSDGVATSLSEKGTTFENFHLKFGTGDSVELDFAIRDPKGKEVKELKLVSPYPPTSVQLLAAPAPNRTTDPDAEPQELCRGNLMGGGWKLDPATKRLRLAGQMRTLDNRDCKQALLEDNYAGKYYVHFWFGYAEANTEIAKVDLPDDRIAKLPELDAEIEKLDKALAALDINKPSPPCTKQHVVREVGGERVIPRMPGIDHRAIGKETKDLWWATSDLFDSTTDYTKRRSTSVPDALLKRYKMAPLVLVYVPSNTKKPVVTADGFDSGEYDARAIVIDRNAGGAICEVAFQARNSSTIEYTTSEVRRGSKVERQSSDLDLKFELDLQAQIEHTAYQAITKAAD